MVSFDAHEFDDMPADAATIALEAPPRVVLHRLDDGWSSLTDVADGQEVILLRGGPVQLAARDYRLRLDPGTVLVPDPREPLHVRSALRPGATLLRLRFPGPAFDSGCDAPPREWLLPMLHDADTAFALVIQGLADVWNEWSEWRRANAASDATQQQVMPALLAAQAEYAARIALCQGRCPARRRDQFLRLARARAVLAWGEGEPADVAALAEVARLSPAHFVRLFHRVFALPPHRYRIERRMQLAYRMIAQTPLPISAILRQIGLGSHSTFSRTFRRHFGMSATTLRARLQGAADEAPKPQDLHSPARR
jgi:AraC family transcriptional regulator